LQTIDQHWREHILRLDHLRSNIGLRGYAQRDPLNEYKSEAFSLFDTMLTKLRSEVTGQLAHVQVISEEERERMVAQMQEIATAKERELSGEGEQEPSEVQAILEATAAAVGITAEAPAAAENSQWSDKRVNPADPSTWIHCGRNEICPCGSGEKYKRCHGK